MQGPLAFLVDFHSSELYDFPDFIEGERSVAKPVNPDQRPEEFSRDRLLGWLFRHLGVPRWGQFFFYVFFMSVAILALLGWFGFLHLSERAKDTDSRIEDARRDLGGRIEQSESRLNTRIDSVITQLAQELIKRAKSDAASNKLTEAGKEIAVASSLISLSNRKRLKVPPEFFTETVLGLDDIALVPKARPTLLADLRQIRFPLAEYRSTLEATPELPKKILRAGGTIQVPPTPASSTVIEWAGPPGMDFIRTTTRSPVGPNIINIAFRDGSQTLDWINWLGVTFINCHIKYLGGRLSLRNVTFVNCTFEFPKTDHGAQAADYIALRRPEVFIQTEIGKHAG